MSYATRYCPKCGLERREGERFCRNCGTALGTGQTSLHESPTTAPPAVQQPAPAVQQPAPAVQQPAPVQPAVVQAPAASSSLPFKPIALGGGALLVIAAILPWISVGGSGTSALDIPVESLWNLNAGDGPIKIGFVTIALGLLGGALSFVPRTATIRRLCGSIALAVVAAFALQFFRAIDQGGGTFGDFFSSIGIGVYLSIPAAIGLQISK